MAFRQKIVQFLWDFEKESLWILKSLFRNISVGTICLLLVNTLMEMTSKIQQIEIKFIVSLDRHWLRAAT